MNEIQPTLLSLDPPAARAFEALAEYFDSVCDVVSWPRKGQLHVIARARSQTARSAERAWNLGRMVLARAAGDRVVPEEDALTREARAMHDEVETAVRSWNRMVAACPIPLGKRRRCETPRESVGALLQEIALEERGIDVVVETALDGRPVVLAMPVDPALATVHSYIRLLDMLDHEFEDDLLVCLEREAADWWFDSWSSSSTTELEEDLQDVRKLEFSLFDRSMLSLDDETIAAAAAQRLPENALTPRQRALVEGANVGVCGCFVVRQRRSHMILLEDVETGAGYEIHEYSEEHECDEGCVVAGRLIPMAEIGWIRSPSAVYWTATGEERSTLAKIARNAKGASYPSIVVELVKAAMRGEELPRFVRPAPSREEAAQFLEDFDESVSDFRGGEVQVDEVLKDWCRALREQSGSRSWGADHDAAQSRKDKKRRT
jgi:hypothetical protein